MVPIVQHRAAVPVSLSRGAAWGLAAMSAPKAAAITERDIGTRIDKKQMECAALAPR
ncbi:hypothetical protein [Thauera sp. 2A1]|uniref:hypothetical protein n=1 Tax=Thauera sp. 2A1 TaxID=2570191 RepID=UPI0012921098|nr:hypothetical protein [Thauera sp. 2A1]KAI5912762.1 hypothetical protein GH664_20775 [Thauera sp. 2A1]